MASMPLLLEEQRVDCLHRDGAISKCRLRVGELQIGFQHVELPLCRVDFCS